MSFQHGPLTAMHTRRAFLRAAVFLSLLVGSLRADPLDRSCRQWGPAQEWSLANPSVEGNPFDLRAVATFSHPASGEVRRTGMFYAGGGVWRFRFTATRPGKWTLATASEDPDLDGKRGTVTVATSDNAGEHGFVSHRANRWIWSGSGRAFVPQIVMYRSPDGYYRQPERIDEDLRVWFDQHGFNGLHTAVLCRWFDLEKTSSDQFAKGEPSGDDPNPDPRTFEALELLITKAHAAGGFVHIWAWGDDSRRMTPIRWKINGPVDRRLQRYIAARLGPLPGWTMGYGFDLWEWVDEQQLVAWHDHLHQQLGWPHVIGGRVHRHGDPLEKTITTRLDYIGYETHRPDYRTYVAALERDPKQPVFMEDRFRIRDSKTYREKDYDERLTRRGLWHSAMAGGVANIWGYLLPDEGPQGASRAYPNREQIRTYATFFENRFLSDLQRADQWTDGVCLANPKRTRLLFYKEDCDEIRLNLSRLDKSQPAIAVDTRKQYGELDLKQLAAKDQTWKAPYRSDWAVAVGTFPATDSHSKADGRAAR